jgi:hypothetical protein
MSESEQSLRERVAELCHAQWSGWMRYMLGDCDSSVCHAVSGPNAEHPRPRLQHADYLARWRRQLATPYADLSDAEKDSDRAEADRFIALIAEADRNARFVEKVRSIADRTRHNLRSGSSMPDWRILADMLGDVTEALRELDETPCKSVAQMEAQVSHEEPPAPLSADVAEHLEFLKHTMRRKPVEPVKE